MAYEMLLSPKSIGSMTVKNRVVMTAAEFGLGQTNGKPTEKLLDYYEERAKGGIGLIIPGICRVNDRYSASTFNQLAMSHDYHIEPMRELVERVHKHGAKLCIQLHHPGKQGYSSSTYSLPILIPIVSRFPKILNALFKCTPALLALEGKKICPAVQAPSVSGLSYHGATRIKAMSNKAIKLLIQDFIKAAERCKKAGVDGVELHGAHGYMIQQFLSPNTNRRTDEYGGSFDNRMRFISEIIRGIKESCGKDFPLIVRLSADEMYERIGKPGTGYDLEEGKQISKRLEELGVDAINVSSACYDTYNYWLEPTSFEPGWRAYVAKAIKETVGIPVIAANYIRSPEQAERQLQEGYQDFIGSARSFICDPHWVKKVEEGRANEIKRCIGCLHCIQSFTENAEVGKNGECTLNPSIGCEQTHFNMPQTGNGRLVVVVGAGPGGLMAAETLAKRGFRVTLLEKEEKPGGQVICASSSNLMDKLEWCISDLMTSVEKLGIELRFSTEATADMIAEMEPYGVIIATGGTPIRPKSIEGIDLPTVFSAPEIIMGEKRIENKKVVVAGSGITGLEAAEKLNESGNTVTVIEMAKELAPNAWFQIIDDELQRLRLYETEFLTARRLVSIKPGSVELSNLKTHRLETVAADCVVLSLGVSPLNSLFNELKTRMNNVYAVGDARQSGRIADATKSAYEAALLIS